MDQELTARLAELETRLAHFERVSEDLSDVVARQGQQIDRLKQQVGALSSRVLDLQQDWRPGVTDDKPPPHY